MGKLNASILVLATLTLLGCGETEEALATEAPYDPSSISWATVRPIIENHCARCHATFVDRSEATRMAGAMVEVIEENPMHGSGAVEVMSRTERNMLLDWARGPKK